MLWNKVQQTCIDRFLEEIKKIEWFKTAGEPSSRYMVADTIYEACDTYGRQMYDVWNRNSEQIEKEATKALDDARIDAVFEAVSLAIGNEVYENICDFEDRLGESTGEDQSGLETEILDFIKRDTAWACIELLLDQKGFFSRVYDINKTGRWACSWVGEYPAGNFIII